MLAFIASALAVLGLTSRTPHPYLTALFQFRHLVLVAAFPTLAVALASEQHVAAAIAAVAAAAWCREFGRKVRPIKRAPGEGHAGDLELVNLNAGDHRSDPAAIVKYLVERSCDVACLQEVCQAHYDIFDEALNEVYPHRAYQGDGIDGLAILSKHPIDSTERLEFGGRLPHLMAHVQVDGRALRVINAHPFVSVAFMGDRSPAANDFHELARVATEGPPTVIMGDFNTTDQTGEYRALRDAGLTDSFLAARGTFGATFPVPLRYMWIPCPPVVRIDFNWHTDHFLAVDSMVGRDASSDHLPLETTLAWPRVEPAAVPEDAAVPVTSVPSLATGKTAGAAAPAYSEAQP